MNARNEKQRIPQGEIVPEGTGYGIGSMELKCFDHHGSGVHWETAVLDLKIVIYGDDYVRLVGDYMEVYEELADLHREDGCMYDLHVISAHATFISGQNKGTLIDLTYPLTERMLNTPRNTGLNRLV